MFDTLASLGMSGILGQQSSVINPAAAQQMTPAAAQAIAAQHAAQISQLGRPRPPYQWMVDGDPLTFEQFVERVFPEDTPERTFFLLKYKK